MRAGFCGSWPTQSTHTNAHLRNRSRWLNDAQQCDSKTALDDWLCVRKLTGSLDLRRVLSGSSAYDKYEPWLCCIERSRTWPRDCCEKRLNKTHTPAQSASEHTSDAHSRYASVTCHTYNNVGEKCLAGLVIGTCAVFAIRYASIQSALFDGCRLIRR